MQGIPNTNEIKMRRIIYVPRAHLNVMSCLFSAQIITATSVVVDDVVYQADGTEPSKAVTTWPLEAIRSASSILREQEITSMMEKVNNWAKHPRQVMDRPKMFPSFYHPRAMPINLTIP